MSFSVNTDSIEGVMQKLRKKNPALFAALRMKIAQIAELDASATKHFKNLRGDLSNYKRVHVGSFVLMFKVEGNILVFVKFAHHDEAY